MQIDFSPQFPEQESSESSVSTMTMRSDYFKRNDENEVSHEALISYAQWMTNDTSQIEDEATRIFVSEKITSIMDEGEKFDYPEDAYKEMKLLERICIGLGYISLVEQSQI